MVKCKYAHVFSSQQKYFKLFGKTISPFKNECPSITTVSVINSGTQLMITGANSMVYLMTLPTLNTDLKFPM